MYADVVVLTYQPPEIDSYTYEIPKELESKVKIGQLVSVPFGKRTPMGIVIDIRPPKPIIPAKLVLDPDRGAGINNKILDQSLHSTRSSVENDKKEVVIKPISSIILPIPILLSHQIELLKWMAFYYHAPMVNCLQAILPELPGKLSMEPIHYSPFTIHQTLVLVPSINRIPQTLAQSPQAKSYIIYHNELAASARFNVWQKILSGNADYIFGSRSAVFTPCPNLKEIIIYDEHENAYKDERSPYYSTLTVAEKLQELTGAKLSIVDSSPRITTYFLMRSNLARDSARFDLGRGKSKVKIVNMQNERRAGNRSPLSQILEDYLKLGTKKGKKILLFLNKKIETGHLYCRNCQYSDFASQQLAVCPNCQSPDIWFSTTNVNSLADLVKKLLPNATVKIISTQLPNYPTTPARHATQGVAGGQLPSIDIATAAVFYKLMTQKYDLVAHIQTDSLLNLTDFTSAEKLFTQISSLQKITRGLLLLQTYNPDDPTIVCASSSNYRKFFQDQLAEREALAYPPFSLLVKLTIKGKKEEKLEEKAQKLYQDLTTQLPNYLTTQLITILGPYKPQFIAKTTRYNIILKLPIKNYSLAQRERARESLSDLVSKVPRDWQVEVEPDSII